MKLSPSKVSLHQLPHVAHALICQSLDSNILANPTPEWQEGLIRRLAGGAVPVYASQSPVSVATSRSPISDSSSSLYGTEEPRTRRRLEGSYLPTSSLARQAVTQPFSSSSTYSNWDEVDDTVDSFGHLALDDMKEVRLLHDSLASTYSSAATLCRFVTMDMHLVCHYWRAAIIRRVRTKPMAFGMGFRMPRRDIWWTLSNCFSYRNFPPIKQEEMSDRLGDLRQADTHIQLPPLEAQHHLIDLYFAWVHPFFPVIHKEQFLAGFP